MTNEVELVTFECRVMVHIPSSLDRDDVVDAIESDLLKSFTPMGVLASTSGLKVVDIDRVVVPSFEPVVRAPRLALTDREIEHLVVAKKGPGGGFSFEDQGDGTSWLNVHGPDQELFDGPVPNAQLRQFLLLSADA